MRIPVDICYSGFVFYLWALVAKARDGLITYRPVEDSEDDELIWVAVLLPIQIMIFLMAIAINRDTLKIYWIWLTIGSMIPSYGLPLMLIMGLPQRLLLEV